MQKRDGTRRLWGWAWIAFLGIAIAGNAPGGASARQQAEESLRAGRAFERELRGGETQAFSISLARNQFLQVEVDQRGIDVVATLLGPDGKPLTKIDSPNGSYGPEVIVAIASADGAYRLEVSAPNPKATAARYGVKVVALRDATPADAERLTAARAFEEAQGLRAQRTAPARRAALEKYQQALRYFQSAAEPYQRALTLNTIGVVYAELGEFRSSLDYFEQARARWHSLADSRREAAALSNLGGINDVLGVPNQSLEAYGQARALLRNQNDPIQEAILLNNIGKIYVDIADWQKAIDHFRVAIPLFRAAGDPRREAITLHNIGVAQIALGDPDRAIEYFQQALPLRRATGDKAGEADTLTDLGFAQLLQGQRTQSLESYQQALRLWRAVGDRWGESRTLIRIGAAELTQKQPARALESLTPALALVRKNEDRRREALALEKIGEAHAMLGEPDRAAENYAMALSAFQAVGDRQSESRVHQGIARLERDRGSLAEARRHIETAIALAEEVRGRVADDQARTSYLASRQEAYEFHIDLLMRLHRANPAGGFDALAFDANERARARGLLDLLSEAQVDLRQGAAPALLDQERSLTQQLNQRATRLMGRNTPAQAEALKKELDRIEEELRQVRASIRKSSPHYAAMTQPQPLRLPDVQQRVLEPDTLLLQYALGEEQSYVWAVSKTGLAAFELPPRARIEEAARRVTQALTARGETRLRETPAERAARLARADADLPDAARRLSEMILAPVKDRLAGNRLVIVSDGALQYVPFSMLPDPGETTEKDAPLVVAHEIATLPSASTLAILREELAGRKPAPRALAVLADPIFSADDERLRAASSQARRPAITVKLPAATRELTHEESADNAAATTSLALRIQRLPYTRQEAARILGLLPDPRNLRAFDDKASRETALSGALREYRYVHFATHGLVDSQRPGLSSLALSMIDDQGRPKDGFLRANEIYNLDLSAELVVLSACQTGLGKEIRGEGLVGLTRGFMYAGAPRIVVSLWNVNDQATAELMVRFYRRMLKEDQRPAAALRAAQIEMWRTRQWRTPYFWAAFVLQGEWK